MDHIPREKEVDKIRSQEKLRAWMEEYQNLVFSICCKMTGDYFIAEDLTQETFLSAYRNMDSFDGDNLKAWLCRIATNKCLDYEKQAARRLIPSEETVFANIETEQNLPEESMMEKEVIQHLRTMCEQLKPPYDEIASLYFCEEHKAEEIARLKEKNLKTIQTQIYRARAMLRKLYRKEHR